MSTDRRRSLIRGSVLALGLVPALWLLSPAARGQSRFFVLGNGLRVFLDEKRDLPLVHIVTGFDVGSKNEADDTNGLVHLLEHCILFRGTTARSGAEVSADIRRHGAYFNAKTGRDLSLFEISLPSEYAGFALRNQRDILFGLDLSQAELDDEKEIILEEFGQMEDDPERYGSDLVLQALFPGHPYGRSVYGRREVIGAATTSQILGFYRKFFVADNCALAVVGDFAAADMELLIREVFGPLPRTGFAAETLPMTGPLEKSVSRRFERDVREGYLFLGFPAPDFNQADQFAMNVLAEVLGRGVNPLLPSLLRGERDLVRHVSMSYLAMRFGGAAVVSIKAAPGDIAAAERSAVDILKRARNGSYSKRDFVSPEEQMDAFDYLESAKNQIRFAVGQAEESGLQLAGSFVRHMLLNTRDRPGSYLEAIRRVDSSDLRRTAAKYFSRSDHAAVSIVPAPEGRNKK